MVFKSICDTHKTVDESSIHFVLTVPAIWDISSKEFMREAAEEVCLSLQFTFITHTYSSSGIQVFTHS